MIVCEYDPHWLVEFQEIAIVLRSALKSKIIEIHHVGSTAIPGIDAKPILDIDIEIENAARLPEIISGLQEIGYLYQGEKGVPDRHAFKRLSSLAPDTGSKRIWMEQHLYVCPTGTRELKRHLRFRDRLRGSPQYRDQYARIKSEALRNANGERKIYVSEKEKLIASFLKEVLGDLQ